MLSFQSTSSPLLQEAHECYGLLAKGGMPAGGSSHRAQHLWWSEWGSLVLGDTEALQPVPNGRPPAGLCACVALSLCTVP